MVARQIFFQVLNPLCMELTKCRTFCRNFLAEFVHFKLVFPTFYENPAFYAAPPLSGIYCGPDGGTSASAQGAGAVATRPFLGQLSVSGARQTVNKRVLCQG